MAGLNTTQCTTLILSPKIITFFWEWAQEFVILVMSIQLKCSPLGSPLLLLSYWTVWLYFWRRRVCCLICNTAMGVSGSSKRGYLIPNMLTKKKWWSLCSALKINFIMVLWNGNCVCYGISSKRAVKLIFKEI